MEKKRKVSVAMTTYNGEKYLRAQIDSILINLRPGDELVISDDGSTDGTLAIIEKYRGRSEETASPSIRLLQGPGRGIIANFAHAISRCTGDVIFLSDQDDVWEPYKAEHVLGEMERTGCSLVMHDAKVCNEDLSEVQMESFFDYRGSKSGFWNNVIKNRYMGCCMAFSSDMRDDILPIPETIQMHDQWIGIMNDLYGNGTSILREPLISYRRHADANSDFEHNSVPVMIKNRMIFLKEIRRHAKRRKS